jgi:hypothetical protein
MQIEQELIDEFAPDKKKKKKQHRENQSIVNQRTS